MMNRHSRIFRYVRFVDVGRLERRGWFWDFKDPPMPGPHGHWSVVMEWLCDCREKTL